MMLNPIFESSARRRMRTIKTPIIDVYKRQRKGQGSCLKKIAAQQTRLNADE